MIPGQRRTRQSNVSSFLYLLSKKPCEEAKSQTSSRRVRVDADLRRRWRGEINYASATNSRAALRTATSHLPPTQLQKSMELDLRRQTRSEDSNRKSINCDRARAESNSWDRLLRRAAPNGFGPNAPPTPVGQLIPLWLDSQP